MGCSGFHYDHWRGNFYPEKLAKTHWLDYYAQYFNTLELNNTFYRYPAQKLLEGWYNKPPDNFTFSVKANRLITHLHKFRGTEQYTANFCRLVNLLREKLLCVLFQMPPMVQKNMDLLQTIAGQLDPSVLNVLEFRHESWWDTEVFDFMDRHGIVFCSVSASELPETIVRTGPAVYVRFHGKDGWYLHDYPDKELETWAKRIKAENTSKVICYFNNDCNANAPKNCQTLKKLLEPQPKNAQTPLLV